MNGDNTAVNACQMYLFLCTLYLFRRKCTQHILWEQVPWITALKSRLMCETSHEKMYPTIVSPFGCGFFIFSFLHWHFEIQACSGVFAYIIKCTV